MFLKRLFVTNPVFRRSSSLSLSVKEIISQKPVNENISVQGWVRSIRKHKKIYFVDVVDGSCLDRLQAVLETDSKSCPSYGCSVSLEGKLVKSNHKGQAVELQCHSWKVLGDCPDGYPFCNRLNYSMEYVRQFPHLRPRTMTFGSVARVRSCASQAIHRCFEEKGFHHIHTPIITLNDCEGAGEVFTIHGNLKNDAKEKKEQPSVPRITSPAESLTISPDMESDDESLDPEDNSEQFFGSPAYLTVSAQLHLEAFACAMKQVYSFAPVFRAEHSRSRQHASEFYMVEAEIAAVDSLDHLTKFVEQFIKEILQSLLVKCPEDVSFILQKYGNVPGNHIDNILQKPFVGMSYSDAVSILQSKTMNQSIKWGEDLNAEHKSCLIEHCDGMPVFVNMFPAASTPFYMREDGNGNVYSFDLLAPFGGEICSGSLRESSLEAVQRKLSTLGTEQSLSWYLDLWRYGSLSHGGFGIGFDRLLQFVLGIPNIRDVIPFPRRRNHCNC